MKELSLNSCMKMPCSSLHTSVYLHPDPRQYIQRCGGWGKRLGLGVQSLDVFRV